MNESTDESDWVPALRIVELSSVLPFGEVHLPITFSLSNMLREQLDVRDGAVFFHENFDRFDSPLTFEVILNFLRDLVKSLRALFLSV